jgi:ATP-dependent exoDNAse (exonuclease V) beta subunit
LIQTVWGAKSKSPEKKETDEHAWSFTSYHGGRPIPPISGRFSRQGFEEEQSEALSRGRKLHKLFEGISSMKEIRQRLVEGCEEGWIEEQEQAELIQDAENLFQHTEIAKLLEAEGELLTEREILLPTGELLRPDRVVIKDNSTLVIDFKTGEKYSKNEQQLLQYQKVLQGMGYPAVKGYLLYLDKAEIVENPPL